MDDVSLLECHHFRVYTDFDQERREGVLVKAEGEKGGCKEPCQELCGEKDQIQGRAHLLLLPSQRGTLWGRPGANREWSDMKAVMWLD